MIYPSQIYWARIRRLRLCTLRKWGGGGGGHQARLQGEAASTEASLLLGMSRGRDEDAFRGARENQFADQDCRKGGGVSMGGKGENTNQEDLRGLRPLDLVSISRYKVELRHGVLEKRTWQREEETKALPIGQIKKGGPGGLCRNDKWGGGAGKNNGCFKELGKDS